MPHSAQHTQDRAHPLPPPALKKVLEQKISIAQLCQQNAVSHLELFGSATTVNFDPATSDFDFLVEFVPQGPKGAADRFFNLKQGLSELLAATIDLVELKAVKNPFFLDAISKSRITIYGNPTQ
ncbi:MAG: nucleotidyltransferase domain-containing protein [Cyanobacteria bacterium P01_F01_bin.13]